MTFSDYFLLFTISFVGSLISDLIGSGADFLIFSFLVLRLDESSKKASFTSVIFMAWVSMVYTTLNFGQRMEVKEVSTVSNFLIWSIPVVIFFAPLGASVLARIRESLLEKFVYLLIVIQYFSAFYILKLTTSQLLFSCVIIILTLILTAFMRFIGVHRVIKS